MPSEPTGGTRLTRGQVTAKCGVSRSDKATCLSCLATLGSGGTSNDHSASAIKAVEETGGATGTPWYRAPRPKKSTMSHVGNGAVNGNRTRATSQRAEILESTASVDGCYKISTRQALAFCLRRLNKSLLGASINARSK
jgi:hypothetical protein